MSMPKFITSENGNAKPEVLVTSLILISSGLPAWLIGTLHRSRKQIARLRAQNLPIAPGWSWVFGNLMLIGRMSRAIPQKGHKTLIFSDIVRNYFPRQGCCYLDLWPFSYPFLMVMSPAVATQAAQTSPHIASERPPKLSAFFKPLAGGPNLFDLPEKEWKPWRAVFNKAFSAENVSSFIPYMVEETIKYKDVLVSHAEKNE